MKTNMPRKNGERSQENRNLLHATISEWEDKLEPE